MFDVFMHRSSGTFPKKKKKRKKERKKDTTTTQISRYQPAINKTIKSTDISKPFDIEPFTRLPRTSSEQRAKQKIVRSVRLCPSTNKLQGTARATTLRDLIMPRGAILCRIPQERRKGNEARAWPRTRLREAHTHMRSPDAPAHPPPPGPLFARGSQGRAMCIVRESTPILA